MFAMTAGIFPRCSATVEEGICDACSDRYAAGVEIDPRETLSGTSGD